MGANENKESHLDSEWAQLLQKGQIKKSFRSQN